MGIPPATAASNLITVLFFFEISFNVSQCFEISALLAVTTFFFFIQCIKNNFFAIPSSPPISSIKISYPSKFINFSASEKSSISLNFFFLRN